MSTNEQAMLKALLAAHATLGRVWADAVLSVDLRRQVEGERAAIAEVVRSVQAAASVRAARLSAVAPKMLVALKTVRDTLRAQGGQPMPTLDAVIAEAED